jgi:hypothetical protein
MACFRANFTYTLTEKMKKDADVAYFKYYSGGLSAGFEENNDSVKITEIRATHLNRVLPQQKRVLTSFFPWRNSP